METTTIFQIAYLLATLLICMIVVYLPRIALTSSNSADFSPRSLRLLDLSNFFAMGVFLATCFVMLMPHVESTFVAAFASFNFETETCYKLVQLVVVLGFLLVYFLEKVLDHCKESFSDNPSACHDLQHLCKPENIRSIPNYVVTFEQIEDDGEEGSINEAELNREDEDNSKDKSEPSVIINRIIDEDAIQNRELVGRHDDEDDEDEEEDAEDERKLLVGDEKADGAEKHLGKRRRNKLVDLNLKSNRNNKPHYSKKLAANGSRTVPAKVASLVGQFDVRCAAMLLALCVHSIFEGMTLGLQSQVWRFLGLAGAVAFHQITAAMAVGVNLTKRRLGRLSFFVSSFLFSAAIPLGVLIGVVLSSFTEVNRVTELEIPESSAAPKVVSACLQALTVGTFIYVIFVEILPSEYNKRKDQVLKATILLFGFTLVTCLAFFLAKS